MMRTHHSTFSDILIAHASCLCALMLSTAPLPLLPFLPMPSWGLILIFYYSMQKPSVFSPFSLTIYGLLYDVLFHAPLGAHACFFPLCYLILTSRQDSKKGRRLFDLWQHFITMFAIYSGFLWIFYALASNYSCIALQLFNQFGMSIIAYPLIHSAFTPSRPSSVIRA